MDIGFLLSNKAIANYSWIHLSLSATMNMNYLDDDIKRIDTVPETIEGCKFASNYFFHA